MNKSKDRVICVLKIEQPTVKDRMVKDGLSSMSLSLGEWSALGTRLLVISKSISEKGKREDHPIIHNPQRLATSLPSLQRNCATESSWRNVKWLTCTTAGLMAVPASLTQQH